MKSFAFFSFLLLSGLGLLSIGVIALPSPQQPNLSRSTISGSVLTKRQTSHFIASVVDGHNNYRAQYGADNLTWSDDLYSDTQAWADACNFEHSSGSYGENLAASSGGITINAGLSMWMDEASQYNYDNPGFSESTGHFTQVVWKSTTAVACAIADSCDFLGSGTGYMVCRYTPAGNVIGEFADSVGKLDS